MVFLRNMTRLRLSATARSVALVISVALIAAGCSASSRQPVNLPPTGPELKIMALGDSLTFGARVPGGYRTQLAKRLEAKGNRFVFVGSQSDDQAPNNARIHEGHTGYWIKNINEYDEEWLKAQPDIIVLTAGTNDILKNAGADAPAAMGALLKSISDTAPRAEIVVSTIPPLRDFQPQVDAYNQALPGVVDAAAAQGIKVRLVNAGPSFSAKDLDEEGVHPLSIKGYNAFGDAVAVPINEIYSKIKSS